jgi:hypothetical protein
LFVTEELLNYHRRDLTAMDVIIAGMLHNSVYMHVIISQSFTTIDTGRSLFIWRGKKASEKKVLRSCEMLQEYLDGVAAQGGPARGASDVVMIREGRFGARRSRRTRL